MIQSHALLFSDFDTEWYKHWARELKQNKDNLESHKIRANKFWQNAVMVQALSERNLLKKDNTCIGFGVGRERLPALFAKYGVHVIATDQDFTTEKAKHWEEHELAVGTQSLNKLGICDPKEFHKNVKYESLDMTKIPSNLHGQFNFLWSNCALGHLGSIESGLDFIIESSKCLKPGGYAVHTTEVNVISNHETVDNNPETVIFRPKDIHQLATKLRQHGYILTPLNLNFGKTQNDQKIAMSPEFGNDYSKLQVGGHIITQVVLIIHKPASLSPVKKQSLAQRENFNYRRNLILQKQFSKNNALLKQVRMYEKTGLSQGMIKPLKQSYAINLKEKAAYVYLEYKNQSNQSIFGMHERLHTTPPIALATSNPIDRMSKFVAEDWHNLQANRPSIYLCKKNSDAKWEKLDYIRPGATFAYRLKLNPSELKKGTYNEDFTIVQEGVGYLDDTQICVKVTVS